jgi:hypothetical protein
MSKKWNKYKGKRKPYQTGGYGPEDIAKIKTDPVKFFEFRNPYIKLNDEMREAIKTIASNRSIAQQRLGDKNAFVAYVARFVCTNY